MDRPRGRVGSVEQLRQTKASSTRLDALTPMTTVTVLAIRVQPIDVNDSYRPARS